MPTRRALLGAVGLAASLPAFLSFASSAAAAPLALPQPISLAERKARVAKLQGLLQARSLGGLLVEAGSSLDYFTGVQWRLSERTTAAIIPAEGEPIIVCPFFEEPSIRETLAVGEVRTWNEADSPFVLLAQAFKDRGGGTKPLAVEKFTRFFVLDAVRRAAGVEVVSGDAEIRACRLHKSPAELDLMQCANTITLAALKTLHGEVAAGMRPQDLSAIIDKATASLGGAPEFSLALINEASAYPHGSAQPQQVREGSIILMDCGCTVHGYQADISRTFVFGQPTPKQRKVWATVKRGQEVALEAARPGATAGSVDDAVRRYYESEGWGPGYRLPGLSHRTGHGIGLDGHEDAYLVHGDATPLEPGLCFSNEPGLYIPGEFGVRLEDCWHMTEKGPLLFTGLAASLENPI